MSTRLSLSTLTAIALLGSSFWGGSMGCKASSSSETKSESPVASSEENPDNSPVLAIIDGAKIHVKEFEDRINSQSPYVRARYTSNEQKREFLDNLIRFEVLAMAAKKEGFDKDPAVILAMKQLMIQNLMKDRLEKGVHPEDISEEEMRAAYEAKHAEFHLPEQFRVSAIVLDKRSSAESVAALALGDKGSSNKGFRELVAAHSTDEASKRRGGDLRYFTAESTEVPASVVSAAFQLQKTGDVVGPIAAEDGKFYILKQTGHRKAVSRSFDEVKRQLQNSLYREKRTAAQTQFVEDLKKNATIEIFDDALAKVKIAPSQSAPEAGPHPAIAPSPPSLPSSTGEATP